MATTTTNLGLTKPAGTDAVDIAVINANMDLLDAQVFGKVSRSQGLPAGTDLNTIKTAGIYYGYDWLNGAISNISTLLVMWYSDNWITQIQHNLDNTGALYVRRFHNGTTWSAWQKISTQDDIVAVTSGTKYYVKYPDGTMIATDSKAATVNCSTAWGGIYTTDTNTFVFDNFLVPFIAAPIMSYGGGRGGGTGDFFIVTDFRKPPTATSPGGVQIARGTLNASLTAVVSYTAIGRWKA